MKCLIDTHICIWAITGDERLPKQTVDLLINEGNQIFVSVASIWEAVIKYARYPAEFPVSGDALYEEALRAGFGIVPISAEDVLAVDTLHYPSTGVKPHKDPFDRIMLAQAKHRHMQFITKDSLIPNYNESCVVFVED